MQCKPIESPLPGQNSLIKVTGSPTLRFLPRVVQQLKMLPRADTKPHFYSPRADGQMKKL